MSTAAIDLNTRAFTFVQSLASELSSGQVDLPSFPDVAMKVRKALDDEAVTAERVARIVGAEAGLAARMLAMANSPAMGYGGKPVVDLKTAVTRLGHANVRTAALAFALNQLRRATLFKQIIPDLERLWRRSMQIAALSRLVADRSRGLNADLAMLAGLLHNIGGVYIVARSCVYDQALDLAEVREMLLKDWNASIGRSIAENWGLPEEVVEAIGQQDDGESTRRGPADLTDVLMLARWMAGRGDAPDEALGLLTRLGLSRLDWDEIVAAGEADVAELKAVLG